MFWKPFGFRWIFLGGYPSFYCPAHLHGLIAWFKHYKVSDTDKKVLGIKPPMFRTTQATLKPTQPQARSFSYTYTFV